MFGMHVGVLSSNFTLWELAISDDRCTIQATCKHQESSARTYGATKDIVYIHHQSKVNHVDQATQTVSVAVGDKKTKKSSSASSKQKKSTCDDSSAKYSKRKVMTKKRKRYSSAAGEDEGTVAAKKAGEKKYKHRKKMFC
eukprot:scaffold5410_cov112-Skeletonema_menzelii.AAC.9